MYLQAKECQGLPKKTQMLGKKKKSLTIPNVEKDMKQQDLLCVTGGNINWYNHFVNNLALPLKVRCLNNL